MEVARTRHDKFKTGLTNGSIRFFVFLRLLKEMNPLHFFDTKNTTQVEYERRRSVRFPISLRVIFLNIWKNNEGSAVTSNISANGLSLISKEEIGLYTALDIWLKIPGSDNPLYLQAEVVWNAAYGQNKYIAGVKIEKNELKGLSQIICKFKERNRHTTKLFFEAFM